MSSKRGDKFQYLSPLFSSGYVLGMALIDALFNRKSIHEKPVLFRSQLLQFVCIPWPLESAIAEKFIKKQETVPFPEEALDPVGAAVAEQKECSFVIRIQMELCFHECCQSYDPISEIGASTGYVYLFESSGGSGIEHD